MIQYVDVENGLVGEGARFRVNGQRARQRCLGINEPNLGFVQIINHIHVVVQILVFSLNLNNVA